MIITITAQQDKTSGAHEILARYDYFWQQELWREKRNGQLLMMMTTTTPVGVNNLS